MLAAEAENRDATSPRKDLYQIIWEGNEAYKESNKIENILKIFLIFNNSWGITKYNDVMSCYTEYEYKQSEFVWGDRGWRQCICARLQMSLWQSLHQHWQSQLVCESNTLVPDWNISTRTWWINLKSSSDIQLFQRMTVVSLWIFH